MTARRASCATPKWLSVTRAAIWRPCAAAAPTKRPVVIALAAQRRAREADLAASRKALAVQLRAAYQIGREEPLKLLLNQKDPERAGRMFVYYSYFGRARAQQIQQIESGRAEPCAAR